LCMAKQERVRPIQWWVIREQEDLNQRFPLQCKQTSMTLMKTQEFSSFPCKIYSTK